MAQGNLKFLTEEETDQSLNFLRLFHFKFLSSRILLLDEGFYFTLFKILFIVWCQSVFLEIKSVSAVSA